MSNVLHWTPEQLEAYRAKFNPEPDRPKAGKRARGPKSPCPTPPARTDPAADLPDYSPGSSDAVPTSGWAGKQTETEKRYNREVLHGRGRFEAVCLYLPGGGRYTPDFLTVDEGVVTFHEVKGSYRLKSQGRAYTAFHEAQAAFPMWRFVWAHWDGREWSRKVLESSVISEGKS